VGRAGRGGGREGRGEVREGEKGGRGEQRGGYGGEGADVLGTPAAGFALFVEPGTGGAGVVREGIWEAGLRGRHCRSLTEVVGR